MSRLTVRLSPAYEAWIDAIGTEQADAARALMVLGAAALGLPGAEREARRLVEADFRADVEDALAELAATRQPRGSHAAAITQEAPELLDLDPLAHIGIAV